MNTVINTDFKKDKIEAKELAEILCKLPENEKAKIFYMVKGIELISEPARVATAAGA